MSGLLRALIFAMTLCVAAPVLAADPTIVVLVPGYFNFPGVKPPFTNNKIQYFSQTIIETLKDQGLQPVVIEDLDPVGSVSDNGARVLRHLQKIAKHHPGIKLSVIAHSAGGLYTAKALTDQPDLPVRDVVTIATPYGGAELADLVKWVPASDQILEWLDMRSLHEFQSDQIGQVISGLRVPNRVHWVALGAQQEVCYLESCVQADRMSWVLSLGWNHMDRPGDGVVSVESATRSVLQSQGGGIKQMENWTDVPIPLDHWKVVFEPGVFHLIGVLDTDYIENQQRNIFMHIAKHLH